MVDHPKFEPNWPPCLEGMAAGQSAPPDYLAFFMHFNAGRYFEAHETLEPRWLRSRGMTEANFFKALIQIAGAFVLIHKDRLAPARRLLTRSLDLLEPYPASTGNLDLDELRLRINDWRNADSVPTTWARLQLKPAGRLAAPTNGSDSVRDASTVLPPN